MEKYAEGTLQKSPMSPMGKMLFDQMAMINEGQAQMLRLGREQMARDVMAWINKTGLHTFGKVPVGELVELCRKAGA